MTIINSLPVAVRVYPEPNISVSENPNEQRRKKWRRPDAMLVIDTETRIDETQRLTFGSYRFIRDGACQEEGLFFGSDLPGQDRKILEDYAAQHRADAVNRKLKLLTLHQFLIKFYQAVYKGRCLLVAFNFPFDVSRIARGFAKARGRFAGGFSLELWSHIDDSGNEVKNQYRPRIGIKHIDGKRALKGFTGRNGCDP
jgi:hypothetical protein